MFGKIWSSCSLSLWVDNVSAPLTSHLKKISFTFQVYYKHTTAFNFPKKEEKKNKHRICVTEECRVGKEIHVFLCFFFLYLRLKLRVKGPGEKGDHRRSRLTASRGGRKFLFLSCCCLGCCW